MATFRDVVDEVKALCGNRRDNDPLFRAAVNQAITALWNVHVNPKSNVVLDINPATDARASFTGGQLVVSLTGDFEGVNGVAYLKQTGWQPLERVHPFSVLELPTQPQREPSAWVLEDGPAVRFVPLLSQWPSRLRFLGIAKPAYLTGDAQEVPLPDSMRAAYVALATAIAKTYLGEAEQAQTLSVMSKILGPRELGPAGKTDMIGAIGLRPVRG